MKKKAFEIEKKNLKGRCTLEEIPSPLLLSPSSVS
jgi:hypothetical protein